MKEVEGGQMVCKTGANVIGKGHFTGKEVGALSKPELPQSMPQRFVPAVRTESPVPAGRVRG